MPCCQSGDYVARFFEDDGFDQLASVTFSIAEPPDVTVGSEAYLPDEAITIHFARGPGNPKDWIADLPAGHGPRQSAQSSVGVRQRNTDRRRGDCVRLRHVRSPACRRVSMLRDTLRTTATISWQK